MKTHKELVEDFYVKKAMEDVFASTYVEGFRSAVKFVEPDLAVKATRRSKPNARAKQTTILITIGRPNYFERRIVKACQKAGVAFPMQSTYTANFGKAKRITVKRQDPT